jgi:uncharacterized protein
MRFLPAEIPEEFSFDRKSKEIRLMLKNVEFAALAHEIVSSSDYEKIRVLAHHDASLADHSVAVAYYSWYVARLLGFRRHLSELARGALLHDFFHYDWRKTRPSSGGLHGFHHPREAFINAELAFGPLTRRERDCVLAHMWPLTPVPPRYPESFIVCMVDKAVSLAESWNALRTGKGLGFL